MTQQHYLESELNQLFQSDNSTWKFLQDGSLNGVWYWDLENPENEWMSPEFWRTFGIDPATRVNTRSASYDIIFEEDLKISELNIKAHCDDPEHPYDQIVRYRHVNGTTVWIRCRGIAIRDASGRPLRMLGVHTDVTKIKQSEIEARAAWKAAEAATAELKSFAYSVSHDMKAPANTMDMLLKELVLLNEGNISEESQELLTMCGQTVDRMRRLIEYVLDYTRIIQMAPEKDLVSLNDVARKAIDRLADEIEARGADVVVSPLPDVIAVSLQMDILIYNLISNALKYCPKDRRPRIRVHAEDHPSESMFSVTVTDNGMGILAENQDRIFRLFQRLHGHDEIPGSGLGLPMCQRIALNHGGTLELVSSLEKGSAFSLCLPSEALA